MEVLRYAFNSIVPILLIILVGAAARRVFPWDTDFYKQLNSLCFRFFLPVLMFCNVYVIGDLRELNWGAAGFLVLVVFMTLGLGLLSARLFIRQWDQKGVIAQCAFHSNQAVLGLSLANALGGERAMVFASLSTIAVIPLFNALSVAVLTYYSGNPDKKVSFGVLLKQIIKNPLIQGVLLGIGCVLIRQVLPKNADGNAVFTLRYSLPVVYSALTTLSRVASPVMLFCLGAILDFGSVKKILPQLTLGVLLRLVICPAIALGAALALRGPLHLTVLEFPGLLTAIASPVAVSSGVMTLEIGGDERLANQLIVWCTGLSLFSLFGFTCLLRAVGAL